MAKLHTMTMAVGVTAMNLLGAVAPISVAVSSESQALLPLAIGDGSAQAGQTQQYVPPGDRKVPQRTEGSGARGCTNSIPVSLNLLAPNDHTARTTLAHPTFLWYVSGATTAPMVFTLTEPGNNHPIFQQRLKADKAGIVELKLPQETAELAINQHYRWTVALVCNEKRPSQNINARAWIQRVASTPELTQKLASATKDSDRALAYTQSGIWYDGLAILNQLQEKNPQEKQAFNTLVSLLEQVGLTKVATLQRQRLAN